MQRKIIYFSVLTFLTFSLGIPLHAELMLAPHGETFIIDTEDSSGTEFTLTNDSEESADFRIKGKLVEQGENGPRRDDRGDEIDEKSFNLEGYYQSTYHSAAWDYDNEVLWTSNYYSPYRISIWDPETGDEISHYDHGSYMALEIAYGNGILFVCYSTTLHKLTIDEDGEVEYIEQFTHPNQNSIYGIAYDRENDWLIVKNNSQNYRLEWWTLDEDNDFDELVGYNADYYQYTGNYQYVYNLEWVPAHYDIGALYCHYGSNLYQVYIDIDDEFAADVPQDEDFEDPIGVPNGSNYCGVAHDGEDLWVPGYGTLEIQAYDDGIDETYLIAFSPNKGSIDGNSDLAIDCIIDSRGVPEGTYEFDLSLLYGEEITMYTMFVHVDSPSAMVSGSVVSAASGENIEGVDLVLDGYNFQRMTSEDGSFEIGYLAPGDYSISFWKPEYLPQTYEFTVGENDEDIDIDIELLHSECNLDRDDIFYAFEIGDMLSTDVTVTNDGDGTLEYDVSYALNRDDDFNKWDEIERFNTAQVLDDEGVQSVLFIDEEYYFASKTDYTIYVVDRDGNLDRSFSQPTEDGNGFRDMAWDGQYIWGGDTDSIYAIDLDGNRIMAYPNPDGTDSRCIAWDDVNELLWVTSHTGDFYGIDISDGSIVEQIDVDDRPNTYSIDCYPKDAEGYTLYSAYRSGFGELQVNKFDLENGTFKEAFRYDEGFDRCYGMHITPLFDKNSWAMVGVVQNRHDVFAVIIDDRTDWMHLDADSGTLDAGDEQVFELALNATDMLEGVYNGLIRFDHNGFNFHTDLMIEFNVSLGVSELEHVIDLRAGWNVISSNVQPEDADMSNIFADLIDRGILRILKDDAGHFMIPAIEYSSMEDFDVYEGYSVLVTERTDLTISGTSVSRTDTIPLEQGWQAVSYLPRFPIEATIALSGIADELVIAKNDQGGFYIPEYNFSCMGEMDYGEGYWMKVDSDIGLTYQIEMNADEGAALFASQSSYDCYDLPGRLPAHAITDNNMSLLIRSNSAFDGEFGVYANGSLVGSGTFQNGVVGISVWGDDSATDEVDGAVEGDVLTLRTADGKTLTFAELEGKAVYEANAFAMLEVTSVETLPEQFGIVAAYPNPFNSSMRVSYNLPENGLVSVAVFDLTGRKVAELFKGKLEAGLHTAQIDGSALASGIYLLRVESAGSVAQQKIALIK